MTASHRIESIDRLRGLVMVLMLVDHARDFLGLVQAPELMANPSVGLFLTRWVTHFCAPVFFLLAGVGAGFYALRGRSRGAVQRFLVTRGLWLVLLDVTVVYVAWMFTVPFRPFVFLQVIWALGWSMVILAVALWLPRTLLVGIALAIVLGHDGLSRLALDEKLAAAAFMPPLTDPAEFGYSLLHVGMRMFQFGGEGPVYFVIYPLVPWCAVMILGYAMVPLLSEPRARFRNSVVLGVGLTVAFVGLRFAWPGLDKLSPFDGEGWMDFLNCQKYPPSLHYLLMTLGPAFLMLAALSLRTRGVSDRDPLLVFGRVPLFFYIAHVFLAHGIGVLWVKLRCDVWFVTLFSPPPQEPPRVIEVYIATGLVLVLLYPVCRWFMRLKARRRDLWWLSYL